jgi:hypothetical protein
LYSDGSRRTPLSTIALAICSVAFLVCTAIGATVLAPFNALKGRACAKLPMQSLGDRPIIQVELARNEDDLRAIFRPPGIAEENFKQTIRDARTGNKIDSLLFIPGYAGFLLTLGVLLARSEPRYARTLFLLAVIAVPLAALCDELENRGIEKTLQHFESAREPEAGDADRIAIPSIVKWVLLTLVLPAYGAIAIRSPQLWERFLLGAILLLAGLGQAVMLVQYAMERSTRL